MFTTIVRYLREWIGSAPACEKPRATVLSATEQFLLDIPRCAQAHLTIMDELGKSFDFSIASIQLLDQTIDEFWGGQAPSSAGVDQTIIIIGSYLGETIRRNHGGVWQHSAGDGFFLHGVFNEHTCCYPFQIVQQRFETLDKQGIVRCYERGERRFSELADPRRHDGWSFHRESFQQAVEATLLKHGYQAVAVTGDTLDLPGELKVGLGDIAAECANVSLESWPELLDIYFKKIESMRSTVTKSSMPWAEARMRLITLLYADTLDLPESASIESALPGVRTLPVLDLKDCYQHCMAKDLEHWGVSVSEAVRIGLVGYLAKCRITIETAYTGDVELKFVSEAEGSASTIALLLKHFPVLLGSLGALFIVPCRDELVTCAVNEPVDAMNAVSPLISLATSRNEGGPRNINARVYYFLKGKYGEIPYTLQGSRLLVTPPAEFFVLTGAMEAPPTPH